MPKLEVSLPDGSHVSHELMDDLVTVGRIPVHTIQIVDASVSSNHAELVLDGGQYRVKDLGSTNGTFVNEEPVVDRLLKDADIVRFGQIDCVYVVSGVGSTKPLPEKEGTTFAVATSSAKPIGFANVSPFKTSKKKKDPLALAVYGFTVLAVLVFGAAVYGILMLHPPGQ